MNKNFQFVSLEQDLLEGVPSDTGTSDRTWHLCPFVTSGVLLFAALTAATVVALVFGILAFHKANSIPTDTCDRSCLLCQSNGSALAPWGMNVQQSMTAYNLSVGPQFVGLNNKRYKHNSGCAVPDGSSSGSRNNRHYRTVAESGIADLSQWDTVRLALDGSCHIMGNASISDRLVVLSDITASSGRFYELYYEDTNTGQLVSVAAVISGVNSELAALTVFVYSDLYPYTLELGQSITLLWSNVTYLNMVIESIDVTAINASITELDQTVTVLNQTVAELNTTVTNIVILLNNSGILMNFSLLVQQVQQLSGNVSYLLNVTDEHTAQIADLSVCCYNTSSAIAILQDNATQARDCCVSSTQSIASLQSDLNDTQVCCSNNTASIASLQSGLNDTEVCCSTNTASIANLQSVVNDTQVCCSTNTASIASLQSDLNDTQVCCSNNTASIADLQTELNDTQVCCSDNTASIAVLETNATIAKACCDDNTASIALLQTNASDAVACCVNSTARIVALETEVANLTSVVDSLSSNITPFQAFSVIYVSGVPVSIPLTAPANPEVATLVPFNKDSNAGNYCPFCFDNVGMFSTGASTATIPTTGYWSCNVQLSVTRNTISHWIFVALVQTGYGALMQGFYGAAVGTAQPNTMSLSGILQLDSGSVLTVRAGLITNGTGSADIIQGIGGSGGGSGPGSFGTTWSMHLLHT